MRTCPYCAEEIQDAAIVCKHCGKDVGSATPKAATPTSRGIACEKCRTGTMAATRVRRFSPGLVVIGYILLIVGLIPLLASVACGLLTTGAGLKGASDVLDQQHERTEVTLRSIRSLPPSVADEYRKNHTVSDSTMSNLPENQQQLVRAALASDTAGAAGVGIAGAAATGASIIGVVAGFFIGVPMMIIGLVLTLRRNVWQCQSCQFVYDRA